eukprot:TRINITY_DN32363_c0_g2_i2.p1 TRINITY_DN32363_c0_g2~~TRINITY_DN32363_c0_g2_i2.p1  ORF type:complete len:614 (-),score=112.66 TRINITY_DN32363_c0_g2_i2:150-1991(-)
MCHIEPKLFNGIAYNDEEATFCAAFSFLSVLVFPRLDEGELRASSRTYVHEILHWLLCDIERHKKRSYLGRFLVTLEVPQVFLSDDMMADVYKQYKDLQEEFREGHREYEALMESSGPAISMRKEMQQLEAEKDQLQQKMRVLKQKNSRKEGFNVLLECTSQLRKAQIEMGRITDKIEQQDTQLVEAKQKREFTGVRLTELRAALGSVTGGEDTMLRLATDDVRRNRETLEEQHRQIADRQECLKLVENLVASPVPTETALSELEDQCVRLRDEVVKLQEENKKSQDDDRLSVFTQQEGTLSKKSAAADNDLKELEKQRVKLSEEVVKKADSYEAANGYKFVSKNDFKEYAVILREKTSQYKSKKNEMTELRRENAVVMRTEQQLQHRDAEISEVLKDTEERRGVTGYETTQKNLETLSLKIMAGEKIADAKHEEISRLEAQIKNATEDKRNQLGPQYLELEKWKNALEVTETEHKENKKRQDVAKKDIDRDLAELRQEAKAVQDKCDSKDRELEECYEQLRKSEFNLQRARDEPKFQRGEGTYSTEHKTYGEFYRHRNQQVEKELEALRKSQDSANNNIDMMLQRKRTFEVLQGLLLIKIECAERAVLSSGK